MATENDFLVLVIDDEEDILAFLQAALEDAGFRVETAHSGREALEAVKRRRPDFISLDLVMPGGSGIAFLHELRRNRDWARIPVMMVTGHARDDLGRADLQKALDDRLLSGPNAYLEKPVTAEKFVNVVRQTLGLEAGGREPEPSRDELFRLLEGASDADVREMLDLLRRKREGRKD